MVPTVFSDENDKRKIVGYFRTYIDSSRAKQRFFQSMKSSSSVSVGGEEKQRAKNGDASSEITNVEHSDKSARSEKAKARNDDATCDDEQVATLLFMGFNVDSARMALQTCGGNVQAALDVLLKQQQQPVEDGKQDKKETANPQSRVLRQSRPSFHQNQKSRSW